MNFSTLKTYLTWAKAHAPTGPFAFIFAQDDIELTQPVAHHIKSGFRQTVELADIPIARPEDLPAAQVEDRPRPPIEETLILYDGRPYGSALYHPARK